MLALIAIILLAHSCSVEANFQIKHQYTRNVFQKNNHCPSNGGSSGPCPGFVIDLVVPSYCGGKEEVSNMKWTTVESSKIKKNCNQFKIK